MSNPYNTPKPFVLLGNMTPAPPPAVPINTPSTSNCGVLYCLPSAELQGFRYTVVMAPLLGLSRKMEPLSGCPPGQVEFLAPAVYKNPFEALKNPFFT